MGSSQQLLEGVIIMLILITLAMLLRKAGVLVKSNSSLFSSIVLKVTLPALIFATLAIQQLEANIIMVSIIVTVVEIICILLAWIIAKILKLSRGETGALMLVSAFGMSTMLGYPIVRQVFPNNPQAFEDAVLISEFGVGLLIFIAGPIIAMYYGKTNVSEKAVISSIKQFLVSPIFLAIFFGILFSFFPIPLNSQVVITIKHLLGHLGDANMLLVALTLGLLIDIKTPSKLFPFVLIAIIIKLLIQPLSVHFMCSILDINSMAQQVALIETAMPSAVLAAIYAKHYNCKPELVSTTIVVTLVLSLISVTVLFNIFY